MNDAIILLSARLIEVELQAELGPLPSCLIPFGGPPVLDLLLEVYKNDSVTLIVGEGGIQVERYVEERGLQCRVISVSQDGNLAESVLAALRDTPMRDRVVVHFADTWITDSIPPSGDAVVVAQVEDSFRFTTVVLDEDSWPKNWIDKDQIATIAGQPLALVGLLAFADPIVLEKCLISEIETSSNAEPFWRAVASYLTLRRPNANASPIVVSKGWHDLGHLDSYLRSIRQLHLGTRSFNSATIDTQKGIFRKTSEGWSEKLVDEIRWYRELPQELAWVHPRVFASDTESQIPSLELEYYGYSVLSEVYVSGVWNIGSWAKVLRALDHVLKEFRLANIGQPTLTDRTAGIREMYLEKTHARLGSLPINFLQKFSHRINCNGRELMALPEVVESLEVNLKNCGLLSDANFSLLHGDLCLSNIVFDRRNSLLKVIDPRGRFGEETILGDQRYDLAKLSHSFLGDYDLLVRNMFSLTWVDESRVSFVPKLRTNHLEIKALFYEWLTDQSKALNSQVSQIRALESLLFFSMVPLHADRPHAQEAFLIRGLELYTEIFYE